MLRQLREARRHSQKEVAEALGVAQSTYFRMEAGVSPLSFAVFLGLAAYYQMPAGELLERMLTGNATGDITLPPAPSEAAQTQLQVLEQEKTECQQKLAALQEKYIAALEELARLKG